MERQEYIEKLGQVSKMLSEKNSSINEIIDMIDSLREYLINESVKELKEGSITPIMDWVSKQSMVLNIIDKRIDTKYSKITFNNTK